jgi:hypothetical protein
MATCAQQFDEVGAQMAPLGVYILEQLGVTPNVLGNQPEALICRIATAGANPTLKLSPEAEKFYERLSWFLNTVADHLPKTHPTLVRPPGMAKRT